MSFMRLLMVLLGACCFLQAGEGGFIAGVVRDRSGAVIAGADVRVQSEVTGAGQRVSSDASGRYSTSELAAGGYQVTVRKDGFRSRSRRDITVAAGRSARADLTIELLPLRQEVTVTATESKDDPMVSGVTVSRDTTAESLPANGRDLHALYSLMPGAILTPASITSGGQFTVGGQRPNANSFRVDGVSGNVGIGISSVPGSFPGGSLPGMTTIGGTQSLASKEETERLELRSADFSAQYGDRPGAQIDIQTRAGENDFHGSLFGYIRPHSLDGTDWFARGAESGLPTASVNGWGGSASGPVWRNHTYFFASFEKADVHDSALQLISVASAAAIQRAGPAYQAILEAFPSATGRSLTAEESVGYSPLQKAAGIAASAIRVDHVLSGHIHLFTRFSYVPSVATSIELGTAHSNFNWKSVTAGMNLSYGRYTHEIRFNYSESIANATHGPSDAPALASINTVLNSLSGPFGGVYNPGDPLPYFGFWSITQLSIGGLGQTLDGQSGANGQRQLQGSYLVLRQSKHQELRAGGDYIDLSAYEGVYDGSLAIASPGMDALLAGVPLALTSSVYFGPYSRAQHWSVFAQDTIHLTSRLDLLFGSRWEFTPTPYSISSENYFPLVGYWFGVGTSPVQVANSPASTVSNWPIRYNQLAPRVGLAYYLGHFGIVVRAGAGIFYDTQMGSIISNENPLTTWQYLPTSAAPAVYSASAATSTPPVLYLPQVLEWRTSLEKSVGESSLLSLSYFGSAGRRLLRNEATVDPISSVLQTLAFTSHGKSDYEALLLQYRANLSKHLYALVSYTWSHSIDTGSSDTAPLLVQPNAASVDDRGSSSFDVRHVLTASFGYRWEGWNLSSTLFARSGFPFDVTTVDRSIGLGFDNSERVNLTPGVPVWISSSSVPGGRELNPAAFSVPSSGQNGTLGRNVLVGDGLFQVDVSLRRQFRLFRGVSMETSISAFNLLNHPAFSSPVSYFGSALFGQSTSTANLMLGSGSPTTGLTPLYQAGGPRTIELGVRFSF
jgi:hypothetical protein